MSALTFTYRAPSADVKAVRFRSDAFQRVAPPEFRRRGRTRTWLLELPRPDGVRRIEYQFEVERTDGSIAWVVDPTNALRASNPFGDRSVLELEGYERPVWLEDEEAPAGVLDHVSIRSRLLRTDVTGDLWTAHGAASDALLPLLVVHDGPEFAAHASLLRLLDSSIAELELRPFRAALLRPPGNRNETYSASTRYANALATEVVPGLQELAPTPDLPGARAAMGSSLGALAAFHAHRLHRHLFGGLFLQSGSFFRRSTDAQEGGFARFARVSRFVGGVLRAETAPAAVPVVMTCGRREENLANNRALRDALVRQRYDVRLHEHDDLHNWVSWRDMFHPHLVGLLERLWG